MTGKYARFTAKPIDLSEFALTDDEVSECRRQQRRKPARKQLYDTGIRFTKSIAHPLLGQAWRRHHAAPLVLMAIKSEYDLQRWRNRRRVDPPEPEIAISSKLCAQLGLSRDARLRGLRALEELGWITVIRSTRKAPVVRIIPGLFDEGKITVSSVLE
jgi:hypothetical protein